MFIPLGPGIEEQNGRAWSFEAAQTVQEYANILQKGDGSPISSTGTDPCLILQAEGSCQQYACLDMLFKLWRAAVDQE